MFGSRSNLLNHVHKKSPVCLANILLKLQPLPEVDVEQEDWDQWVIEAALRKRGLSKDYAEVLVKQAYGSLRTMVIPLGHSRRSRFPL